MPRVVCLGEILIDLFPDKGPSVLGAGAYHPMPGGAPANVAVGIARLGGEVGFVGKVGADPFGASLISLLDREGVDATHCLADPRAPTMLSVVSTPRAGEQRFALYHGAEALLRTGDLSREYITGAAVFVHGSVILSGASRVAAMAAARWVREAGKQVLFDVNLRPGLWSSLGLARRRIREALACATVAKMNEDELEFLTGSRSPEGGSRRILEMGPGLCCVSLGEQGAYFDNGTVRGHVPAIPVEAVDTTGSGDAFVAGIAWGLSLLGEPPREMDEASLRRLVRFANGCGAIAATRLGAMAALPAREEVERFIETAPPSPQ